MRTPRSAPRAIVGIPGIPVVPVFFALWVSGVRTAARKARAVSRDAPRRPGHVSAGLLALASIVAVIAAAEPRWGTNDSAIRRDSADLVVVLDVSRSMAARDVAPARLDAAKAAITRILERLGGDRAGLVVFGGTARLRFPLTTDMSAARLVVESIEADPVFVQGGTDTASGLDIALAAFAPNSKAGKVILLISDGENLGPDPAGAATRVRDSGAELLVAGVGTPAGARIPVYNAARSQFSDKLGPDGQPLVSKLNEPFLRSLAAAAGGRYLGSDLAAVPTAVSTRVGSLQRARIDSRIGTIPVERFQWFAAAALALLLVSTLVERLTISAARKAMAPAFALMALMTLPGCASRAFDLNEQGLRAYDHGESDGAIDLFYRAQSERRADPVVALNLAAALHRAGRFDEAVQAARRALLSPDAKERARAYASIGHHQFGAGRLDAALDAFKQALLLDPGDHASRHDYEVVLRLLTPSPDQGEEPQADGSGNEPAAGDRGQPNPGGAPGAPGRNEPGTGASGAGGDADQFSDPRAIERRLTEIDREVQAILDESGGKPGPSDALRILELLAERSQIAAQRGAFSGSSNPNDY